MATKSPTRKYSLDLMKMVTEHYVSKKFAASWEVRRPRDEEYFYSIHPVVFPFKDIWDEFSAHKGEYVFLAKLVRVASVADGWSLEMGEHFGGLAMSLAARAKVLQGMCASRNMRYEARREIALIKAFYGDDCPEADWPHCAVIAAEYAADELLNAESRYGVLYGNDIDLQ